MSGLLDTVHYAFQQSDACGKLIVLILIAMSAASWGIMMHKALEIWEINKTCDDFLKINSRRSPLNSDVESCTGPLADLCARGLEAVKALLKPTMTDLDIMESHSYLPRKLTDIEIDKVRAALLSEEAGISSEMESGMVFMGLFISLSPFLGLFGTVWGVMATFIGIAQAGRPDLMAIAPGISGALLTTVAGLLVAIPALIGNNLILKKIQEVNSKLDSFVDGFTADIQLQAPVEEATQQRQASARSAAPSAAQPQQPRQQPLPFGTADTIRVGGARQQSFGSDDDCLR